MKKPSLTNSQKAALVALTTCSPLQQKINRNSWSTMLNGVEYQGITLDSLVKHGAIKKNRADKTLSIPAHYTLTERGTEWAAQLPVDLEKKKAVSSWQAHIQSRGEHTSMQAALRAAGSGLRSATVYDLMQVQGLLRRVPRISSTGDEVFFRKLTEEGEKFGRNIPTFHPDETEAVFHPSDIPSLLRYLGLL